MKLVQTAKDKLVFHLAKREKQLLLAVLKLYPRIPPAHQPLSKSSQIPDHDASQRLLDDALAEQRSENKKQLEAFLSTPHCLEDTPNGCRLALSAAELEWLLQILNDIRVGSWVRLGSPEAAIEVLDEQTAPEIWAMEMAGLFQMQLLEAWGMKRDG